MLKYLIGTLAGGAFGYLVLYKLIGCSGGSCPITANPYTSTIYGIVLGLLLTYSIVPNKNKPKNDKTTSEISISQETEGALESDLALESDASNEESLPAKKGEYKRITAKEAKQRMDSGDDIIILDVRTKMEYNSGHIKNAILLPNENIKNKKPDVLKDMDAEILVYCRSGSRSATAAKKLIDMGYTNVYDFGGIMSWEYETIKD